MSTTDQWVARTGEHGPLYTHATRRHALMRDAASPQDYKHHNEDAERVYYEEHRYYDPSEYAEDDWYEGA